MTESRRPTLGPPARALVVCGVAQLALLLLHDFGADVAGHALQVSPVNALMLQVPLYAVGLLIPTAVWCTAYWLWPRFQKGWTVVGTTVAMLLMCVSVLDFGMQRFRGERVSLSQLSTYGTGNIESMATVVPTTVHPF